MSLGFIRNVSSTSIDVDTLPSLHHHRPTGERHSTTIENPRSSTETKTTPKSPRITARLKEERSNPQNIDRNKFAADLKGFTNHVP